MELAGQEVGLVEWMDVWHVSWENNVRCGVCNLRMGKVRNEELTWKNSRKTIFALCIL